MSNPSIFVVDYWKLSETTITEKNYWADTSYYSDLEVTIYGQ